LQRASAEFQQGPAMPVGQKSKMADAHESLGQHLEDFVSVSLGLTAVFLWGGKLRSDPVRRLRVEFVYHVAAQKPVPSPVRHVTYSGRRRKRRPSRGVGEARWQATTMLTYNVSTPLIVPASGIVWVGAALDNDNGAGSITAAQFNSLGGLTFDPPTFGIAP
jgi:hypothetical protein